MKRQLLTLTACTLLLTAAASAAAAQPKATFQVTPVGRLPFPERGYVIDLVNDVAIKATSVSVSENGVRVGNLDFQPLAASRLRYGVVLAIDASDSMAGRPVNSALTAARSFVARRGSNERVGLLAFNSRTDVLAQPTTSSRALTLGLSKPPTLAYGTRIYDTLAKALEMLAKQRLSTSSIVLLSDGADVGSRTSITDVLNRAQQLHIRIFTVGLRSRTFDASPLKSLAKKTSGAYIEAKSVSQLTPLYTALSQRLASEYLLQYRSQAPPKSQVSVQISIARLGAATQSYRAPTPSGLAPFHRSLVTRFLLSRGSLFVLSLLVAALIAGVVQLLLHRKGRAMVARVNAFFGSDTMTTQGRKPAVVRVRRSLTNSRRAQGWLAQLARDLEIADSSWSAHQVVIGTAIVTLALCLILALVSPIFAVIGLLTPLAARGIVRRRLKQVRDQFAEQLPPNLQVLASALRTGHSFSGALSVVADNAHDPLQREFKRVITDDQLGVQAEEAIRRVAIRMNSRDLEQIALLAELQRTSGGNATEVLDTVVATIRERADIRRLVKTLTAQGRMARWILTALPVVVALATWLIEPSLMGPLFQTGGGQIALVIAISLVVAGSLVIERIVDIKL
jgi:Flp pilus assembly protein TadB/Mg-chelatase subunit ChlD